MKKALSTLLIIFLSFGFGITVFSQAPANMEKIAVFPDCKDLEGQEQIDCTNNKLFEFIISKMVYPAEAVKEKIEGTVIVSYDIDKEGFIQNLKVVQSVHPLLDTEAVRVMEQLPQLDPATLHGRPVSMQFNVPLMFKLFEEEN